MSPVVGTGQSHNLPGALRPLAIGGTGAVTAAGQGVDVLWARILEAQPLAQPVTRYTTEGVTTRRAALVPDSLWRALAERWPGQTRSVLLALAAVDEATQGAAIPDTTALFVGTSLGAVDAWEPWHRALVQGDALPPLPQAIGHADTAPLLARALGLHGTVVTVSTACTSSTAALIQAADALRLGEIDRALVVGVDVLGAFVHIGFDRLSALSPDHLAPAPFAVDRAGMWLGEGAAAVVLTRDDADCLAHYLGGGAASDGVHMTAPDRNAGGMRRATLRALTEAGAATSEVAWVSAHATATPFNDAMEATGLRAVFGETIPPVHGAKPVLGHCLGASGLLEVVLCVEVLRRRLRPPTYAPRELDPALPSLTIDRETHPLSAGLVLTLNSALAGHNTAVVLGAP